jgi:hypothetical protein
MLRSKSLKVKFRTVALACLCNVFGQCITYFDWTNRCPQTGQNVMNNEKTEFVLQVATVDPV